MKKYTFLALLLISIFIFSCSKKNEITSPENTSGLSEQQSTSRKLIDVKSTVPEFNEKNSKKVPWDQLPAELRNATRLDNSSEPNKVQTHKGDAQASGINYQPTLTSQQGPWGGTGGGPFYIWPTRGGRIYAIAIRSGSGVDAITVWYKDSRGELYAYGAGGTGGRVSWSYFNEGEYIWAVAGNTDGILEHLYIWTNFRYLNYGGSGGTYFQYVTPNSYYQILGFFGGSGIYIDRIGFYIYTR